MDLKKLRENKGLTQKDLALILKISESYVWQVENRKKRVGWKLAKKWAKLVGIKESNIFSIFFDYENDLKSQNEPSPSA